MLPAEDRAGTCTSSSTRSSSARLREHDHPRARCRGHRGVHGLASTDCLGRPADRFRAHTLPGASPEEVESELSQQIEEVVNTVDGIDELRSINGNGASNVIVTFRLDRDIDTAAQDVRDRVSTYSRSCRRASTRRSSASSTTTRRR
jgi:hypothetical protein